MNILFRLLICSLTTWGFANIPILDMGDYYSDEKHSAFITEMSKAMQDVGFFCLVNTGVDKEILEEGFEATKRFFALDEKIKLQYDGRRVNLQRGFVPQATEVSKLDTKYDYKELFHIGRELNPEQQARLGYYKNIWPKEMDCKTPLVALFGELNRFAKPLQAAFAEAIDMPKDFFYNMTKEGDFMLRTLFYPPNRDNCTGGLWAGEHTDIDLFTILPKSTAKGLEAQDKWGTWLQVEVPDDGIIINVGDMLENITNGYFRSALHRVRASGETPDLPRYSMVLFIHSKNDDPHGPLPSCIAKTGGKARYAEATRWELLMERLADIDFATPDMLKELAKSGLMERQIAVGRGSIPAMKRLQARGLASDAVLTKLQ